MTRLSGLKKMREFELVFKNVHYLSIFIKNCEALCSHSDTALFKIKKRGIYILLTDFESICVVEFRATNFVDVHVCMNVPEFSAKILLDSLLAELRQGFRNKSKVTIAGESGNLLTVQYTNIHGAKGEVRRVKSTESRLRVFHVLSTREFIKKSDNYIMFQMMNVEFNKIVTGQAIISGIAGGVGNITVTPITNQECTICFSLCNDSGTTGSVAIHTSTKADDVTIFHIPQATIQIKYFVTYLKRSQSMLNCPTDYVTIYISEKGIMLHTSVKEGMCTVLYTRNISDLNLDSYA
jgi:hypothetical protein